jgi:thiol-disulfide isomerase/thioredoxin
MLSSLWPVGGAASKQREREQSERRAAALVKPLASRLELEAELEACEAPGAPPLVVIMSTSWCGPCKLLAEDLQEAAEQRGPVALRVVKIDVEQVEGGLADVASALKIQKLPTVFFCGGQGKGKPALRTTGLLKKKVLDDLIDNRSAFLGTDLIKAATY